MNNLSKDLQTTKYKKNTTQAKKKQHTKKSQVTVLPKGKDVVDLDVGYPGAKSDINLFRKNQDKFHQAQMFSGDKGYVGSELIKIPNKKMKTKPLTQEEKAKNRELARERIFVEHIIRLVKILSIAQERFRLNPSKYESIVMQKKLLYSILLRETILKLSKFSSFSWAYSQNLNSLRYNSCFCYSRCDKSYGCFSDRVFVFNSSSSTNPSSSESISCVV